MSNDSFDKGFRDKLGYFSTHPSKNMWEDIEKDLDRKKDKKTIFLFTRIAAILLPVTALIIGIQLITKQPFAEDNNPTVEKSEVYPEKADTSENNISKEEILEKKVVNLLSEENYTQASITDTLVTNNNLIAEEPSTDSGLNLPIDSDENLMHQLTYMEILEATKLPDTPVLIASINPLTEPATQQELHEYTIKAIEDKTKSRTTKIEVGAAGGPLYTSGIKESVTTTQNSSITTNGSLAYAGGMNILIKPWKRLSMETGVYYAKHSVQNEISTQFIASSNTIELNYLEDRNWEISNSADYQMVDNNPLNNESTYSFVQEKDIQLEEIFNIIEIPVVFKYRLMDRKFDINMIYSIGALYEVSRTLQYDENLIAVNSPTGYETNQKMNMGNAIGFGLDIPLQSKFVFNIEPQAKYYLLSKNSLFLKDDNNYSLNLMMGLKYRF